MKTGSEGSNEAHNNLPPYIVLKACRKVKDLDLTGYAAITVTT